MAVTLQTAYAKSQAAKEKPTAAVFTFGTSKESAKQRIGFAVSEIFTHQLSRNGTFSLLEREDINRVLGELKLNMSGVTEQSDAMRAGKLASADLLILGSVEKLGETYHVNARLVQTENGEVLATAYEALPASEFEQEARDYILVPQKQAIGIYFLYNYRNTVKAGDVSGTSTQIYTYKATAHTKQAQLGPIGVGMRYNPTEKLMFDVSFSQTTTSRTTQTVEVSDSNGNPWRPLPTISNKQYASSLRALVGLTSRHGRFAYFFGGGLSSMAIFGEDSGKVRYTTPTFLVRGGFHPQERIGIELSAGYDLTTKGAVKDEFVLGKINTARLRHFYLEPSFSFYF